VRAARDLLLAFGIEPGMGEPCRGTPRSPAPLTGDPRERALPPVRVGPATEDRELLAHLQHRNPCSGASASYTRTLT
jgi:hypothetical protein